MNKSAVLFIRDSPIPTTAQHSPPAVVARADTNRYTCQINHPRLSPIRGVGFRMLGAECLLSALCSRLGLGLGLGLDVDDR